MNTTSISFAVKTATEFAVYLNSHPHEKQNWSALDAGDDIPEEDYMTMKRKFGECTREMESAYRKAFNAAI